MSLSEATMRFDDPKKRNHGVIDVPRPMPKDIALKAALKKNIPEYYSTGSMILSLDTLELFAARGYGTKIQKVSDVEIGGSVKNFPRPGVENKIYIATVDPKGIYVWRDADAAYHQVSNTNDEGDYCFDSDIVHFVEGEDGAKLIVAYEKETVLDPKTGEYIPTGKTNLVSRDELKPIEIGRSDRIYIDNDTNELYRFDPARIVDVDEQDGGQYDIRNGFVKIGATAPETEKALAEYKEINNRAVEAVTQQAANTESAFQEYKANVEPRILNLETATDELSKTKASIYELTQVKADLKEEIAQEAANRGLLEDVLNQYKKDQADRDKEQDDALTEHVAANDEKFASLDGIIAQIKADLYADIRYALPQPMKQVAFGKLKTQLDLPSHVQVMLDDGTKASLETDWSNAVYNAELPGEPQDLTGSFLIPKWMKNPRDAVPVCRVVVGDNPNREGSWMIRRFILPLMATDIKRFSERIGFSLSNEDVFGEGYQTNGQEALSRRHFELRLIGATFQTQAQNYDGEAPLVMDEEINLEIDHNFAPAEYYRNGIIIPVRTMSKQEQEMTSADLSTIGFCSDVYHPYWNGAYTYDEATDTLRFLRMGQSTALVYEARKCNDGYVPYPASNERIK